MGEGPLANIFAYILSIIRSIFKRVSINDSHKRHYKNIVIFDDSCCCSAVFPLKIDELEHTVSVDLHEYDVSQSFKLGHAKMSEFLTTLKKNEMDKMDKDIDLHV